jgi:hypothetical protein
MASGEEDSFVYLERHFKISSENIRKCVYETWEKYDEIYPDEVDFYAIADIIAILTKRRVEEMNLDNLPIKAIAQILLDINPEKLKEKCAISKKVADVCDNKKFKEEYIDKWFPSHILARWKRNLTSPDEIKCYMFAGSFDRCESRDITFSMDFDKLTLSYRKEPVISYEVVKDKLLLHNYKLIGELFGKDYVKNKKQIADDMVDLYNALMRGKLAGLY